MTVRRMAAYLEGVFKRGPKVCGGYCLMTLQGLMTDRAENIGRIRPFNIRKSADRDNDQLLP